MTTNREELEKVMVRVRKLLAMGTSKNEHEASAMVGKAQELMERYDLTMESIENLQSDTRTSVRKGSNVMRTTEGKPDGWKADLFRAVADTSDCFTAVTYTTEETPGGKRREIKHYKLIGFGHDVEMAGYILSFLIGEIERLAQEYANIMWAQIRQLEKEFSITHQQAEKMFVQMNDRHPLKAKLYFIKGATEAVTDNLHRAYRDRHREAAAQNPHAIVLLKRDIVRDTMAAESRGMTLEKYRAWKAEQDAEFEKSMVVWRQQQASHREVVKPETDAERRKREAREYRQQRTWNRQYEREQAKMDKSAMRAGREAGDRVAVRPGIKDGGPTKGEIG